MLMICEVCGKRFQAKSYRAKYCSGRCRTAKCRGKFKPVNPRGLPASMFSLRDIEAVDELTMLVHETRELSSLFVKCANTVPIPFRGGCKRVGEALKNALEIEKW